MKIHQIVVRPEEAAVIVLYLDGLGERRSMVIEDFTGSSVQDLIAECERRLPPDSENPAKPVIQQEITELEKRLTQLKQAIGAN